MGKHLTHVLQLVNKLSKYSVYSDSFGIVIGGVWTSGLNTIGPIILQLEWPHMVKEIFTSGTLNINYTNLSGLVFNWHALECITSNLTHNHASLFCDNTSAAGWMFKLRSGYSLAAGHLFCFLRMLIHATKASHLTPISISGKENDIADVVSCTFQKVKFFVANNNLTSYFQNHFPLPQGHFWT